MDHSKRIVVHMKIGQVKTCLDNCPKDDEELIQLLSGVLSTFSDVDGYQMPVEETEVIDPRDDEGFEL